MFWSIFWSNFPTLTPHSNAIGKKQFYSKKTKSLQIHSKAFFMKQNYIGPSVEIERILSLLYLIMNNLEKFQDKYSFD